MLAINGNIPTKETLNATVALKEASHACLAWHHNRAYTTVPSNL